MPLTTNSSINISYGTIPEITTFDPEKALTCTSSSFVFHNEGFTAKVPVTFDAMLAILGLKTPEIKKVIYNNPATIILWDDGSKTVVKVSENDTWDPEKGFLMAYVTKLVGKSKRNKLVRKWVKPQEELEQEECMYNFWLHSDEFIERAKDLTSHLSEVFSNLGKDKEE